MNAFQIITVTSNQTITVPLGIREIEYHIEPGVQCTLIDANGSSGGLCLVTLYCAQDSQVMYYLLLTGEPEHAKQIRMVLHGRHARAAIRGLYFLEGSEKVHIQSRQEHVAADTSSDVVIKGVLFDATRAVYEGTIYVDPQAVRIDANQQNKNLLLSEQAQVRSIPSLEVLTNNVRCKHGSAVGSVDPMQLFYLQSRGIAIEQAHTLLVHGFIADLVQDMPVAIRDEVLSLSINNSLFSAYL